LADLGSAHVTGVEQTVLDLVHRPDLGGSTVDAADVAKEFGVALEQVRRDHFPSHLLAVSPYG
jgi:hypothetical protein